MVRQLLLKELEMPPAHRSATLISIVLWMASCLAAGVSAAGWPASSPPAAAARADAADRAVRAGTDATGGNATTANATRGQDWQHSFAATLARARALLEAGYGRAPALVIALGTFIVLPGVALASFLVQWLVGRRARHAAIRAAELRAWHAEPAADMPTAGKIPLWSHEAWLTVEGPGQGTLPLDSRLIRIGRHQDNDVQLPDTTVHRYHAVIERTPEEAFVIVDLSGKDGSGVRINGERQSRAQLFDGGVIELGRTRLKFESVSA